MSRVYLFCLYFYRQRRFKGRLSNESPVQQEQEPESKKNSEQEKDGEDKNLCEEILKEKLGVRDVEIEEIFRMGREREGKTRAVAIKVRHNHNKWQIVKRAKQLREDEEAWVKKIGIAPDMTQKEREESEKLREELQEKKKTRRKMDHKKRKSCQN